MSHELSFKTSMTFAYGVPSPVSPGIVRIVAENPSPLTFKGTNTYLVGMTELAVIDPGPRDGPHLEAILKAAAGRPIRQIIVTHAHCDHVDGADALKAATNAPVLGYGRADFAPVGPNTKPQGSEFIDYVFEPDMILRDSDIALLGRGVLFSGDHVMAWNTSLVAPPEGSMSDYIASLERLLGRNESIYLPGHGGRLDEPQRTVKAYLLHRRWREDSILDAIRDGVGTITDIVPVVYPTIDRSLTSAAALSVQAHVEHLISRGLVVCDDPIDVGPPAWDRPLSPA
jgi:glyoxylase-like metal-dependent hydrolase (beta-lactamase superfamily II)